MGTFAKQAVSVTAASMLLLSVPVTGHAQGFGSLAGNTVGATAVTVSPEKTSNLLNWVLETKPAGYIATSPLVGGGVMLWFHDITADTQKAVTEKAAELGVPVAFGQSATSAEDIKSATEAFETLAAKWSDRGISLQGVYPVVRGGKVILDMIVKPVATDAMTAFTAEVDKQVSVPHAVTTNLLAGDTVAVPQPASSGSLGSWLGSLGS